MESEFFFQMRVDLLLSLLFCFSLLFSVFLSWALIASSQGVYPGFLLHPSLLPFFLRSSLLLFLLFDMYCIAMAHGRKARAAGASTVWASGGGYGC